MLDDVANVRFDAHLRNFGVDFEQAKLRIRHCYYERRSIKIKTQKYSRLFFMS